MSKTELYSYKGNKLHRRLKYLALLILAGIIVFGCLLGVVLRGAYDEIHGEPETMLILGCKVMPEGHPSMLLQDRLDEALDYLDTHPDMTVIVSGGQGPDEPTSEADAMAAYLVEKGVSEDQILREGESHNTVQNFARSLELMERENLEPEEGVLVVSNGFHLTRARMLAQRAGYGEVSTLAAPASHMPSRIKMYIREPLALVKSWVFDR